MNKHSIIRAFLGARTWYRIVKGHQEDLVIVIPDHDTILLNAMKNAVSEYVNHSGITYSQVLIVYAKQITNDVHRLFESIDWNFQVISNFEMTGLIDFMLLTSKQYGAICQKNVKLVSLEEPYGGQLKLLANNNLFPLESIVKSSMLDLE